MIDALSIGGAEMLLITFASQAHLHGVKMTVIGLYNDQDTPIIQSLKELGVQIEIFPGKHLFSLRRILKIIRFIKRKKIDLMQTHSPYANVLGGLAGWFAGVPVIATLHTTRVTFRRLNYLHNRIEFWVIKYFVKRVVAVGQSVADVYRDRLGKKHVDVICNAVLPSITLNGLERQSLRNEFSIALSSPLIIAVGRIVSDKGFGDLISAFTPIHARYPKARLLIIGDGDLLNRIKKQVSVLKLEDAVHLPGERYDVPQWLAASDIFISSSHWEGLPLVVLEAMMAGLPIIATAVGDLPQVVTPDIGFIVPPHDPLQISQALLTLLEHPQRRHEMGRAAQKKAIQQYSAIAWFKKIMDLYYDVLHRAPGSY